MIVIEPLFVPQLVGLLGDTPVTSGAQSSSSQSTSPSLSSSCPFPQISTHAVMLTLRQVSVPEQLALEGVTQTSSEPAVAFVQLTIIPFVPCPVTITAPAGTVHV